MSIQHIFTESSMERDLGYARAVVVDGWVFVSGTAGVNYATREFPDTVEEQARQMIQNLRRALTEAGSGFEDVVKRSIYVADKDEAMKVYEIVVEAFRGKATPASEGLQVTFLNPKIKCEMTVIARIGAGKKS